MNVVCNLDVHKDSIFVCAKKEYDEKTAFTSLSFPSCFYKLIKRVTAGKILPGSFPFFQAKAILLLLDNL